MAASFDFRRASFERELMPLDAARTAFGWLVTGPNPLSVEGRLFPDLPHRRVPLNEVRERLLRRRCGQVTRDAVWAHLVLRSRTEGACGCRIGHPYEATWAYSWISPPSRSRHRRRRPDGDACGCRIGHPYEATWAYSWISPPSPTWHRRRRPGGDLTMITSRGGRVVASADAQ
jgi:hypothetical protein